MKWIVSSSTTPSATLASMTVATFIEISRKPMILEQSSDVEAAIRRRPHDGRRGEARHALDRVDAFDLAGDAIDEAERVAREQPVRRIGGHGDDQRPRAAELASEAFVI